MVSTSRNFELEVGSQILLESFMISGLFKQQPKLYAMLGCSCVCTADTGRTSVNQVHLGLPTEHRCALACASVYIVTWVDM